MRDIKVFVSDIFRKPPILFPLVAIFHVIWFIGCLRTMIQFPANSTYIAALFMLTYTVFWIGLADLRKWGAIGYILITTADIIAWYMGYSHGDRRPFASPIFPIDILFCFFAMFYFKRFR